MKKIKTLILIVTLIPCVYLNQANASNHPTQTTIGLKRTLSRSASMVHLNKVQKEHRSSTPNEANKENNKPNLTSEDMEEQTHEIRFEFLVRPLPKTDSVKLLSSITSISKAFQSQHSVDKSFFIGHVAMLCDQAQQSNCIVRTQLFQKSATGKTLLKSSQSNAAWKDDINKPHIGIEFTLMRQSTAHAQQFSLLAAHFADDLPSIARDFTSETRASHEQTIVEILCKTDLESKRKSAHVSTRAINTEYALSALQIAQKNRQHPAFLALLTKCQSNNTK